MKAFIQKEDGASILLLAFGMSVFISFLALVLDMGSLYLEKSKLQKIVDASALAGAQELPLNYQNAVNEAKKSITFNGGDPNSFTFATNEMYTMLEVVGAKTGTLYFAKALGINEPTIKARARVTLQPLSTGKGVIPLGLQPSTNLSYGVLQKLKVSDSASGNFGAIALTGPGAKEYETDLKYGYEFPLKVNEVLDTQTGQLAGPTKRAIEQRISHCPSATYIDFQPDCSRVVLVPIYEPVLTDNNQVKQVRIVGFATFFLEGVSSTSEGAEVSGRFIRLAISGESSSNQSNFGTFGYKLTQ